MRIMLGTGTNPSLLVDVVSGINYPTEFKFYVINGAWNGFFNNGYITINGCPVGDYSSLVKMEILSDNPDRLRG